MNNQNQFQYYPNMYMAPMQINNQNPSYYQEYQNYYYVNPPSFSLNQQMLGPPYYPQYIIPQNSLEDSLNMMYNRGMVNNIIGAFFIKECQERQHQRKSEKRKVPISTVDLNDDQENENLENNNGNNNINANNNEIGDESNNKLSYMVNDFKLKNENAENQNNENVIGNDENNNLKKNEQEENKEKKEEEGIKEEGKEQNENELKKPNMI